MSIRAGVLDYCYILRVVCAQGEYIKFLLLFVEKTDDITTIKLKYFYVKEHRYKPNPHDC